MVDEIFDSPELTFEIESFDASARLEFLYAGINFDTAPTGTYITFEQMAKKVDILSPIKDSPAPSGGFYVCNNSVIAPGTEMEEITYTFPEDREASIRARARGAELYYAPGGCVREVITGVANQTTYTLSSFTSGSPVPIPTKSKGADAYIYYLAVNDKRLFLNQDYTESYNPDDNALSFTLATPTTGGEEIVVVAAKNASISIPEDIHPDPQTVLPAAIKHGFIEVFFELTPNTFTKIGQIINLELTGRSTIDMRRELGNEYPYVTKGSTEITGTMRFRPFAPRDFYNILKNYVMKETATRTFHAAELGATFGVKIVLRNPYSPATILKTFYLPAARLTLPGFEAAPDTEMEPEVTMSAPGGEVRIYKGAMP